MSKEDQGPWLEGSKEKEKLYMLLHYERFRRIFEEIPIGKADLHILDVGTTPFTFFLKKIHPYYDVATVDFSELLKNRCLQYGVDFIKCDLNNEVLPFPKQSFDIVIFSEVLEHLIIHPRSVFIQLRQILKDNGMIVFTTPNLAALHKRILLFLGRHPMEPVTRYWEPSIHGYGHFREYLMSECLDMFKLSGYHVKTSLYESYWDCWNIQRLKLNKSNYSKYMLISFLLRFYNFIVRIRPPLRRALFIVAKKRL
ncbi:MAG: methyltransferase domain-containing protein [Candidatus Methylarchaceae archaeon HK02M1]|nr:methyltransferase domain-containing protein [Candidatus Methylarchaceae archaeon HK02M1]